MTRTPPKQTVPFDKCTDLYTCQNTRLFNRIAALAVTALATFAAPLPAASQTPLGAEEFEALTTGKTITYTSLGVHVGTEQYREGRRVIWRPRGGTCKSGTWFPQGSAICFRYDDTPDTPACWQIIRNGNTLIATDSDDPSNLPLTSRSISEEPMDCPAPDLGV